MRINYIHRLCLLAIIAGSTLMGAGYAAWTDVGIVEVTAGTGDFKMQFLGESRLRLVEFDGSELLDVQEIGAEIHMDDDRTGLSIQGTRDEAVPWEELQKEGRLLAIDYMLTPADGKSVNKLADVVDESGENDPRGGRLNQIGELVRTQLDEGEAAGLDLAVFPDTLICDIYQHQEGNQGTIYLDFSSGEYAGSQTEQALSAQNKEEAGFSDYIGGDWPDPEEVSDTDAAEFTQLKDVTLSACYRIDIPLFLEQWGEKGGEADEADET